MKTYKRCITILADGARADVLRDLVLKGELKEIGNWLAASGSLRDANSTFPSTTGPAYLPYLTGCYPGTCNLPGIRWFDKNCYATNSFSKNRFRSYVGAESFYMNNDLAPDIKTLFELIPRSVNIFSSINRGVSAWGNKTRFSRAWYWYYAHLTDHWSLIDEAAGRKIEEALKEDFEFLFAVFPGVDEFSHLASPTHPRTLEAYRVLDHAVGLIARKLKREGKWEETVIFIVSDHGLSETSRHLPLNQFLERNGIKTLYYPKVFKWGFDAASMVSGNGMAHLYFKNEKGWKGRTAWEQLILRKDRIVEKLLEQPEVDILAAQKEDGTIVVKSKRGEAEISVGAPLGAPNQRVQQAAPLQYHVMTTDPFGYPQLPSEMTNRQSLELTDKTDYPDALMQLAQIFRAGRTGDLVLSATKGHDLRLRHEVHEHKSSHGGLHWEQMKVPLVTNVRLSEGPARSVDVFPTILKLLGRPIPSGIDGKSLLM